MGAAAGKQMHSEKAKHAAAVLNAVQNFDENHAEETDTDLNKDPELFKRRVLLAAAEAKLNGNDIENSLAQLSDADLVSLCQYVENQKEEDANKSASLKIEEIVDEDNIAQTDNIDETTSVLSYGDDEEVPDNESENEESGSGFGRVAVAGIRGNSGKNHHISSLSHVVSKDENDIMSSGDEIDEHVDSDSMLQHHSRNPSRVNSAALRRGSNGVRVFPMGGTGTGPNSANKMPSSLGLSRGGQRSGERPSSSAQIAMEEKLMFDDEEITPRTPKQNGHVITTAPSMATSNSYFSQSSSVGNKHLLSSSAAVHSPLGLILPPSMAEKYSRIWEPEPVESGPLTSTSMAFDSPTLASMHSSSPGYKYKFNTPNGGTAVKPVVYKDIGERIDERNDALMGLQRQKVISYTQNAQLEREVEALQRQLEKMDQLDSTLSASKQNGIGSSASTHDITHNQHTTRSKVQGNAPHFSHIYPIDEESRSLRRDQRGGPSADSEAKHSHHRGEAGHFDHKINIKHHVKHHKHGSSSSSDTDNSSVSFVQHQQQQPQHAVQRFPLESHLVAAIAAQEKSSKTNNGMHIKRLSEGKAEHNTDRQSDYIPSVSHQVHLSPPSSLGPTKAKQHIPAPRRRVRNGVGAGSSGAHNGNSSGFDSDDSTNSAARHPAKGSVRAEGRIKEALSHHPSEESSSVRRAGDKSRVEGLMDHSGEVGVVSNKHKKSPSNLGNEHSFRQALSEDESDNGSPTHLKNFRSHVKADGGAARRHRRMTSEENTLIGTEVDNHTAAHISPNKHHHGKGTALKKLNKRRHSMDGSGDDHLLPHEESSAASHDEDVRRQQLHDKKISQPKERSPMRGFSDDISHASLLSPPHGVSKHTNSPSGAASSGVESRIPAPSKPVGRRRISGGAGDSTSTAGHGSGKDVIPQFATAIDDHHEVVAPVVEKRRRGRVPSLSSKPVNPPVVIEISAHDGPAPLWSPALDNSWAEVSLLLRKPIKAESDMQYTVAAAEAGIIFIEQMDTISKAIQVQRGALSRWLLPFDNNTRIDMQCSTPHSVVENMPDEFRGKLTERQVHYLVGGANGVRQLVRIKIADDNDLEQARSALLTTDRFFKMLYHVAQGAKTQPYQLLQANY